MNKQQELFHQLAKLCLVPPGDGVYTVNTAKAIKKTVQQKLYPNSLDIYDSWKQSLRALPDNKSTVLLGIASDCGGGILRGANWGPLYIREQLLSVDELSTETIKTNYIDLGDIKVIPHLLHDKYLNQATIEKCRDALYGNQNSYEDETSHNPTIDNLPVSPLSITEKLVSEFYLTYPNKRLCALGGDHSVSYPLVKAYLQHKKAQGIRAGILHFDAHTDLLTERLGIDICFGSWTAHILPFLQSPADLIQVGIRSSGRDKDYWQNKFGVKQIWSAEILESSISYTVKTLNKHIKTQQLEELYISFDIDVIDEMYAPFTGTPEPNGIKPNQAVEIIKRVSEEIKITGADLVEVAPFTNVNRKNYKIADIETMKKTVTEVSTQLIATIET